MDHPQIGIGRAALLARLLNHVTCNLRGTINLDETVYAWTDSRIVLCWLQTSVHTLEVFVANRVSQITGSETPLVWRHVPGEWNPADCASRGCRAPDLVSHPLWWGPQWLTESPQEWPFNECRAPLGPPDRGLRVNVGQLVPKPNPAFLLERYSSLDKLLGVTGWIKRFVNNCRKPQAERNFTPVLSPAERNAALCSLVRVVQAEHFEEEVRLLRDGHPFRDFDFYKRGCTQENFDGTPKLAKIPPHATLDKMVDTQHFCLRWNNYQSSITSAFENLRDDEDFVDVTLACDGKSLKAHRVVLSACSPYFRELLKSTPCKHPVIVLQDVAFTDLHALVEFIYHGEVNVHQRSLSSFLKTAEVLRVSGLTQNDDAQGPLVQSLARAAAAAASSPHTPHTPHTPPHPAHTPHTPSYTEKLEEALLSQPPTPMMRRIPLPPRRMSRSADNSPDVIKRVRHDNNNTEQQIHATDFSTKHHGMLNNSRHEPGNNGNGISNSSSSPSPRLMDDVKNEPIDMICGSNADIERSIDDTPPHSHRPIGGPPSRGSSADADDRTPPPHPQLPPSPFIQPADTKLFAPSNTYNFTMAALTDHPSLAGMFAGLPSPLAPDGMASTSQGGARTPQEDYRCEPCNKSLSSLTRLKRHIQNVHMRPSREPVCNICRRVYSSLNSLRNHKSIYHRKQQAPPAPAGQGPFFPVN
ncbi:BTB/POZ domain-containing protein [Phthorimaea operculella]|nr:BTB/POZ domain-containing protein [Phthorimaea operculella]